MDEAVLTVDSSSATNFDVVLGTLEEVMMGDGFGLKVDAFMREHCGVFASTDENKHEYMDLFSEFATLLEEHIEGHMRSALGPSFRMDELCNAIRARADELPPDLEALAAYGDFEAFKRMMVDFRTEARYDSGLALTGLAVRIHEDDVEDGVPMPDLNISISSPAFSARGLAASGA